MGRRTVIGQGYYSELPFRSLSQNLLPYFHGFTEDFKYLTLIERTLLFRMKQKGLIVKILSFLRPKFYDRITWTLVITGLGLISTSTIERIIWLMLERTIKIPIVEDIEPIYGLIVVILGLIYNTGIKYLEYKKELLTNVTPKEILIQHDLDLKLLNRIREILPSNGSIGFLRDNNFAGFGFRWSSMDQLHEFIIESKKPEFRFIDNELQDLLEHLIKNISEFLRKLSANSFTSNAHTETSSIPSDMEIENPNQFWEIVNYLNERQTESWKYYDLLVSKGRRALGE